MNYSVSSSFPSTIHVMNEIMRACKIDCVCVYVWGGGGWARQLILLQVYKNRFN